MSKGKFTTTYKIAIIKEASSMGGVTQTLAKYDVYPDTYCSLRRKLKEMGEEGFQHGMTS